MTASPGGYGGAERARSGPAPGARKRAALAARHPGPGRLADTPARLSQAPARAPCRPAFASPPICPDCRGGVEAMRRPSRPRPARAGFRTRHGAISIRRIGWGRPTGRRAGRGCRVPLPAMRPRTPQLAPGAVSSPAGRGIEPGPDDAAAVSEASGDSPRRPLRLPRIKPARKRPHPSRARSRGSARTGTAAASPARRPLRRRAGEAGPSHGSAAHVPIRIGRSGRAVSPAMSGRGISKRLGMTPRRSGGGATDDKLSRQAVGRYLDSA